MEKKKSVISTSLQIKDEEKIPALILLVVIFSFVLVYFFLVPVARAYKSNKVSLNNLKTDQMVLEEKQQSLKDLDQKIKEKQVFIDQTKEVLPQEPQVAEILLMVSGLAGDNGLYVNNFTPKIIEEVPTNTQNKAAKTDYKKIELQIDITGSYPNLKDFLKALENNIRPVDVVNISIKGGGEIKKDTSELLRFNIKGYIYYQ